MFHATIVIPTFNRQSLLNHTIRTLIQQKESEYSFEIIIVDDGSTDNTRSMVEEYMVTHKNINYHYKIRDGFGAGMARNIGIKQAQGEIIIFLDSGLIVGTDFVERHCRLHFSNKNETVVVGDIYGFQAGQGEADFFDILDFADIDTSLIRMRTGEKYVDLREENYTFYKDNIANTRAPWFYFWTANISASKKAIEHVGLFDDCYKTYGMEDTDLGYKLYQAGASYVICREAGAIHLPHESHDNNQDDTDHKNNAIIFHRRYKTVLTEQYYMSWSLDFNKHVDNLTDVNKQRFDFNKAHFHDFFTTFFKDHHGLIVGAHNGGILTGLDTWSALEYDESYYTILKKKFPENDLYNLTGGIMPFENQKFDMILITDFWKHIETSWVEKICCESARSGKSVYIILSILRDNEVILEQKPHDLEKAEKAMAQLELQKEKVTLTRDMLQISFLKM